MRAVTIGAVKINVIDGNCILFIGFDCQRAMGLEQNARAVDCWQTNRNDAKAPKWWIPTASVLGGDA